MNDQLILKFPTHQAYKKEDFYVSPSNQEAYDFINSWPKWIKRIVNIFGPTSSGKTHFENTDFEDFPSSGGCPSIPGQPGESHPPPNFRFDLLPKSKISAIKRF